jgi:hypothetical protein
MKHSLLVLLSGAAFFGMASLAQAEDLSVGATSSSSPSITTIPRTADSFSTGTIDNSVDTGANSIGVHPGADRQPGTSDNSNTADTSPSEDTIAPAAGPNPNLPWKR